MNVFRAIIAAAVPAAILWTQPATATRDFRDIGFLAARLSVVLEYERTGTVVAWSNPETGNGGKIVVTRTYFLAAGSPCRDYTRTTDVPGGAPNTENGTGCRDRGGRWTLTEGQPSPGGPISILPVSTRATPAAPAPPVATAPLPPAPASPPPAEAMPKLEAEPPPKFATATIPSRTD